MKKSDLKGGKIYLLFLFLLVFSLPTSRPASASIRVFFTPEATTETKVYADENYKFNIFISTSANKEFINLVHLRFVYTLTQGFNPGIMSVCVRSPWLGPCQAFPAFGVLEFTIDAWTNTAQSGLINLADVTVKTPGFFKEQGDGAGSLLFDRKQTEVGFFSGVYIFDRKWAVANGTMTVSDYNFIITPSRIFLFEVFPSPYDPLGETSEGLLRFKIGIESDGFVNIKIRDTSNVCIHEFNFTVPDPTKATLEKGVYVFPWDGEVTGCGPPLGTAFLLEEGNYTVEITFTDISQTKTATAAASFETVYHIGGDQSLD